MSNNPPIIQVELLSDDDDHDHDHNNNNTTLVTPVSNHKRPRTEFQPNPTNLFIIDDDPTPQKCQRSVLSTPSFVPETPFSDLPFFRCSTKDVAKNPSSGSSCSGFGSGPRLSGVGGLICLESDDEAEGGLGRGDGQKGVGPCPSFDEGNNMERSPEFFVLDEEKGEICAGLVVENCLEKNSVSINSPCYLDKVVESCIYDETEGGTGKGSWLQNRGSSVLDLEETLNKSPKFVPKENQWDGAISPDLDVNWLGQSPRIIQSTRNLGDLNATKVYNSIILEDDVSQISPVHEQDHNTRNGRLEEEGALGKPKGRGKDNATNNQNKDKQVAKRKKSQEEKMRLMEEKKLKREQEKMHKEALKAEAAKSRQLQKDQQRWQKDADKNILAEIDLNVVQSGQIGGLLLQMFGQKGLRYNITSNPIEKSIVWRMIVPEELSQLSSRTTEIPYVLLVYSADEFCKVALDGSLIHHISSAQTQYPSYTICCLTNRLMSFIHKREQDKYKNRKAASDWQRPPVEEVFAKLATHFDKVHTRQCADEAELAEHVVGLTLNLAKCRFRKKLSPLSVSANGSNVPKDCVDRDLILKNPWLKALVSIPKVQPRFAIAISKKYPTMKSLLSVYMDPNKSVLEKEFLLKDLTTDGLLGNNERRVGEICSKRVYRVLTARNGSIKTDDVETGADYFTTQS